MIHVHVVLEKSIRSAVGDKKFILSIVYIAGASPFDFRILPHYTGIN